MDFLGAGHGWGGRGGGNPLHISYNNETWHSYTLPKEDSKNV